MTATNTKDNSHIIEVRISLKDQRTGPIVSPPPSKTIARQKAKAEEKVRNAAAAQALIQTGLRPPAEHLFAIVVAGLLRGPRGGIGTTECMARLTLAPLAAGGRYAAAVLVAAGGWADEQALREALGGLGPRLAALGLRIDQRKTGIRMAKVKPAGASS